MNQKNKKNVVSVKHEWGTLKEVIIGISPYESVVVEYYSDNYGWSNRKLSEYTKKYGGRKLFEVDRKLAVSIEKQVDSFAHFIEKLGIRVHRNCDLVMLEEKTYLTPKAEGLLPYVRDPIIVIDNIVIEASIKMMSRRRERYAIRPLLDKLLPQADAYWISAPPPYPISEEQDRKSIFLEGGDVLVNGFEIYVGASGCASNKKGAEWLQRILGLEYKVHVLELAPHILHLDCALSLIGPELGIIYREGIISPLPDSLKNFEFIEISSHEAKNLASNVCILDQRTLIIDTHNARVAEELRKKNIEVILLPCDGPIFFGGGFRCLHHPLVRES